MKEHKQHDKQNHQKTEENNNQNKTNMKDQYKERDVVGSTSKQLDDMLEEVKDLQGQTVQEKAIPDRVDSEYEKVKRIIRHRKWWTLAAIISVVLIFVYVIPWVVHRHNIGKIYNIYINELTQKDEPFQISHNKTIENELHSPETYIGNFQFNEEYSSNGLEKRTFSWQNFDTLGFRKEFTNLYAYENDAYCIDYAYDEVEDTGKLKTNPVYGSSDSLKKFYSDQYITLYKMTDYQNYWNKEEFDRIPDHSLVGAYVKFRDQLTLDAVIALEKQLNQQGVDMGLRWISVFYNSGWINNGMTQEERKQAYQGVLGFDIFQPNTPSLGPNFDQAVYPYLVIKKTANQNPHATIKTKTIDYGNVSSDIYEQHFISMLQYLYDQPNYMKYLGDDQEEQVAKYPEIIEQVKTNGIHTDVVYVTTTKEHLQVLMDQKEVKSAFISDIK